MRAQTEVALGDADVILLVVDARSGLTPLDRAFGDLVRRTGKPIVVVANKSEGRAGEAGTLEAFNLGLGDPVAISAEHGRGNARSSRRATQRVAGEDIGRDRRRDART